MGGRVPDYRLVSLDRQSMFGRGALAKRKAWYLGDGKEKADKRDAPVIEALNELVEAHPRSGFWMCFKRLRLIGKTWNHKRVWRIY